MKKTKVLMVTTQEIIMVQNDGGKIVSYRNYKLLKDIFGKENVFLCMIGHYDKPYIWEENIIRIRTYHNKLERILNLIQGNMFHGERSIEIIREVLCSRHIDILFLDRSLHGELVKGLMDENLKCKIWVFAHNVEADYFENKFRRRPFISRIIYNIVKANEKETLESADCILGLTDRDRARINEKYEREMKYIIPVSLDDFFDVDKVQRQDNAMINLLFVGALCDPNYEGIKWFVNNVMKFLSDWKIHLTIVGKGFEKKRKQLQSTNVHVIGTVEDVSEYYYQSHIIVIPVFRGAGQKVKFLEAMMYGKIILATDEALEGYEIDGVEGIHRCVTANDFVGILLSYSKDTIETFSETVRDNYLYNYSYQAVLNTYGHVLGMEAR